ncbi:MAG TPA: metallophosphoesterase [Longimicrobium sp.]|nr:metallophosphoesterase [Longimicrobium sp.]
MLPALATLAAAAVALGCAAAGVATPATAQEQQSGATVLLVSDLHFDPFTADSAVVVTLRGTPTARWAQVLATSPDTALSTYNSDSNFPLLQSAAAAIRQRAPKPAFVVITGDFLGHSFESKYQGVFGDTTGVGAFADSTMAFMAGWAATLVPAGVPIYPSIGNNDSGCDDYGMSPSFFQSAARSWAPLAQRGGGAPGFAAGFASAGWYMARPPAAGVTLLMMNDVYWSRSYDPDCGADQGPQLLRWVAQALDSVSASRGRAWLAGHIPPGVDIYSSLSQPSDPEMMLAPQYIAPYDSLVRANAGVVTLQLTGHTHMNEFRVYAGGAGGGSVPDVGLPAVSPKFGNNPGFVTMRLSPAGDVLGYTVYAYTYPSSGSAGGWGTLFDFNTLYRQSAVTGASLLAAAGLIASDPAVRTAWELAYVGGRPGQNPNAQNWRGYWCAIQNIEAAAWTACVNAGMGGGTP